MSVSASAIHRLF